MADLWVFGYGSLMWRPGFGYAEARLARLSGYHRSLCIRSHIYRGTPERPGLVLGLDRGGSCLGMAFRVEPGKKEAVRAYLRERELVTNVYKETVHRIRLDNGMKTEAVTYVVDRSHGQYAGRLVADECAAIVSGATGKAGPNSDYVINTVLHLRTLGIHDAGLEAIAARLG